MNNLAVKPNYRSSLNCSSSFAEIAENQSVEYPSNGCRGLYCRPQGVVVLILPCNFPPQITFRGWLWKWRKIFQHVWPKSKQPKEMKRKFKWERNRVEYVLFVSFSGVGRPDILRTCIHWCNESCCPVFVWPGQCSLGIKECAVTSVITWIVSRSFNYGVTFI